MGKGIDSRFLIGVLRSPLSRFQYEQDATGTSGSMQNIGQDTIKNLIHALPPLDEQQRIGAWLENSFRKDAHIEEVVRSSVKKLAEYRRALITAAVTGQIGGLQ
jgi:type I restriction enzyme S subunit